MLTLLLASCFIDCPRWEPLTCSDVAIRDGQSSQPDPCDLEACLACVDTCGEGCQILESYPPRYTCGGQSWDLYDVCPDWTPERPVAVDIADPECGIDGGELLEATAPSAGRIEVAHRDAMTGCCPEALEIALDTADGVLAVDYTLVNDDCECACELDLEYAIDDVPAGSWTVVATDSGASVRVTVP